MTPEQLAARWLDGIARFEISWRGVTPDENGELIPYADAIAAIARHLAPGDDLVAQATAALEGVTPGKPCQFHPSYCKEAEGTPFSEWDSSHDLSVILPDGKRYKIGHFRHSADAGFDQFARQWVPEAAARIAALTATVAELEAETREMALQELASLGQAQEAWEAQKAAEAEVSRLRDRLARMEGALTFYKNGFQKKTKRSKTGLVLSVEYLPTPALLDDCGNRAIDALDALTDGGSK